METSKPVIIKCESVDRYGGDHSSNHSDHTAILGHVTSGQTLLASRIDDVSSKVLDSACRTTSSIQASVADSARDNLHATYRSQQSAASDLCSNTASIISSGRQNTQEVRGALDHNFSYVDRSFGENRRDLRDLARELCDSRRENERGFGETRLDICKTQNALERQAADNASALKLQAAENASALKLQLCLTESSLSKQLAMCCCEVKEKIDTAQFTLTTLFNATDANRIRDDFAQARFELLIQKNAAVGV